MRTIKQAAEYSGIPERLIRAVIRQTGNDNLEDIMNHGADAGYAGLTYYSDTCQFYKRNKSDIIEVARNLADDLGENLFDMIAGFNCLKTDNADDRRKLMDEIGRTVYGRINQDDTQVANALTWFAAEEVARAVCDE